MLMLMTVTYSATSERAGVMPVPRDKSLPKPKPEFEVAPGYVLNQIPYGGGSPIWIDDDTVLFVGSRWRSASEMSRTGNEIALHRWNTKTNEIEEIAKAGPYANLCYDRGFLYLSFVRGDEVVTREGPIGRQTETVTKRGTRPSPERFFDYYNCRFRDVQAAIQTRPNVVAFLRDDHGFIELERTTEPLPQRKYFLVPPSGERIWLKGFPGGPGNPPFSQFRQAYIYQYGGSDMSAAAEKHIWEIGIDGHVTDIELPKGFSGYIMAAPARDGMIVTTPGGRLDDATGAYIMRGKDVKRIVKAFVNPMSPRRLAVSPNGCKVAMSIQPVEDRSAYRPRPDDEKGSRHAVLDTCR